MNGFQNFWLEELAEREAAGDGFATTWESARQIKYLRFNGFVVFTLHKNTVSDIKLTEKGRIALAAYQLEKM
jgi:hypothetical protein